MWKWLLGKFQHQKVDSFESWNGLTPDRKWIVFIPKDLREDPIKRANYLSEMGEKLSSTPAHPKVIRQQTEECKV